MRAECKKYAMVKRGTGIMLGQSDEYTSLRNEIISCEEQQRTVWIYMYILFGTLFVLGIERSYFMFLVTYIILIPFQVVINRYAWSITKLSTYIRLFYEQEERHLNWESMHTCNEYKLYYKNINSSITGIMRNSGGTQLGFLSTSFFIIVLLYNNYQGNRFHLTLIDVSLIFLSLFLFLIIIIINKEFNKSYDNELELVIQKYKERLK